MANTTVSAGKGTRVELNGAISKDQVFQSILRLSNWLEKNHYRGYDTFDGLSAKYLRALTFETKLLRTVLQQGVRRFPMNLRPLLGIPMSHSSKGMGFLAKGFIRLHRATGNKTWANKAETAFQWLLENKSKFYSRACWGNHFDYQSRGFFLPKDVPTIVWTSHIGHAFLDGYQHFKKEQYLQVAVSACEHIVQDLERHREDDSVCFSYVPLHLTKPCHNANTLGASLLARTSSIMNNSSFRELAEKSIRFTAKHQRPDSSWYYGEAPNTHWVDNFHTAYVLDCFKYYYTATGDDRFLENMRKGYDYWKRTFFLADGTPKYYDHKTLPIDIQCSSQAIDTLVFFHELDPDNLGLALNVAKWTIDNMQDEDGHFYYRRYSPWAVNKTSTLHWGQATMLCGLAGLYELL
jgi:rhamnogalacturonyl hydrolase YesR